MIVPVLDATARLSRDFATTTPVNVDAAGAAVGRIATVATTAAARTSFLMEDSSAVAGLPPQRVPSAENLARARVFT
jgi:microcompartment protein CcmK/EutM